jgi:tripartite-type tricarboxylate transporter receptor subunit TctC
MTSSIRRPVRPLVAFIVLAGLAAAPVHAEEAFPSRSIQFIVPFSAGGGLDLNARNFAQALSDALQQSVVVTNRDGAAGTIGLQAAATARPDGYTVAFTPAVSLTSEPHRLKTIAYKLDSFKYVCQVFDNIFAIAVPKNSPYKSVADLVAGARAEPGKLSYGTSGTGSIAHLGISDVETASKTSLTHLPYKGDAPMLQDLLAQRLDFGAVLASSIVGQLNEGSLRLLAVYSERRHPGFPQTPTLTEAGVPVVQLSFGGLLVPAQTPANVVAKLEAGCEKAVQSPKYQTWAQKANQVVAYQPGAAFEKRMREDSQAKAATIKRLGL